MDTERAYASFDGYTGGERWASYDESVYRDRWAPRCGNAYGEKLTY